MDKGIVNIDHMYVNGQLHIYQVERDGTNTSVSRIDSNFVQYFYIPKNNVNEIEMLPEHLQRLILRVDDCAKPFVFGGEVVKITVDKNVEKNLFKELVSFFSRSFEGDIHDVPRYILDSDVHFSDVRRIQYIDIETDMSLDIINTNEPIISISAYDNMLEMYFSWCWRNDLKESSTNDGHTLNKQFSNERDMLHSYIDFVRTTSPDIITGWNVINFDIPYIVNRMNKLGINANALSTLPIERVNVRKWLDKIDNSVRVKTRICGREIIDLLQIYKKLTYDNKPDSYSLGGVGKHELGIGKIIGKPPGTLWREDIDALIKYNLRDVELCVKVDAKRFLIKYYLIIQQLCPMQLDLVEHNSVVVDMYMLHKNHHVVFPTKVRQEKMETPEGSFCGKLIQQPNGEWVSKVPKAKIYSNVAVFDFAGMYPSIYTTFNISPETVVERDGDITIDGVQFTDKKSGILPSMIAELSARRQKIRDQMRAAPRGSDEFYALRNLQGGVKGINNSIFGVSGFPSFRLYDLKVLSSIMYIGRQMLVHCNLLMNKMGYDVIYCDTDSLMVPLKGADISAMYKELEIIEKTLNASMQLEFPVSYYPQCAKSNLKIDCEKIFSKLIMFDAKKKYIGRLLWLEGTETNIIFHRGVSIVKHDTPNPLKDMLKSLTELLMNEAGIEAIQKELQKINVDIRKLNHWEIGMMKNVSKHLSDYDTTTASGGERRLLPHIRAVIYSNEHFGTKFSKASTPKIVYVKHPKTDVIAIESDEQLVPSEYIIDYDLYLEKHIYRYLNDFVEVYPQLLQIKGVKRIKQMSVNDDAQQKLCF